ncbi:biotin/lipoyl-containing protein [Anaerophaga thermohalophila]|jgi:biotin carboxyl carrier protein|uniref:biotin/lipoyl-containing protein n=1 Tax=Anaerophaga thermohalophila TaxID=177400 RepID=UPI0002E66C15|nr:biotin/lipoyl-containing protein [Anaerophaga thermohalophila]
MKKYLITVNEKQYEVEVEEVKANAAGAFQTLRSAPKLKSGVTPNQIKSSSPKATPKGGHQITAPMPGSVYKILVAPGDEVKKGQTLLVFEAMKMENDLTSPADGKISAVNVTEGDAIAVGDVLIVIE